MPTTTKAPDTADQIVSLIQNLVRPEEDTAPATHLLFRRMPGGRLSGYVIAASSNEDAEAARDANNARRADMIKRGALTELSPPWQVRALKRP